jgi:transcriptional regulator with XRE-family HTH domain
MRVVNIANENDDETILAELGRRLARTRLERNISQQGLAAEAGVSKRTVERIEAGDETRLTSFVRVLRVLGLLDQLDRLVPEPLPSPLERLKLHGRARQRAAPTPAEPDDDDGDAWRWGDGGTP